MRKLTTLAVCALVGALPVMAQNTDASERLRESVDASIDLDRDVIEGLRVEARTLEQAERDVMAAPGARFTAEFRLAAARSLGDAADALFGKVKRLEEADRRLVEALEDRAQARLEIRQSISTVTEAARTGVFAELDRTPNPLPELLDAKEKGLQALANAETLGERLIPREVLQVTYLLQREVTEEEEALTLEAFQAALVDRLGWEGAAVTLSEDRTEIQIRGTYPEAYSVAELRAEIAAIESGGDRTVEIVGEEEGTTEPVELPGVQLVSIERRWNDAE